MERAQRFREEALDTILEALKCYFKAKNLEDSRGVYGAIEDYERGDYNTAKGVAEGVIKRYKPKEVNPEADRVQNSIEEAEKLLRYFDGRELTGIQKILIQEGEGYLEESREKFDEENYIGAGDRASKALKGLTQLKELVEKSLQKETSVLV